MPVTDPSPRAAAAVENLPPFPHAALKVAELLRNEPASLRLIADTLKTDAALSAEVLRLANSPLVEVRYKVTSVLQALALLGAGRVSNLIMTLTLSKMLARAGRSDAMRRLWRHNLACALAAQQMVDGDEMDEAYYAGLFHDIGRLALFVQEPALYDRALSEDRDVDEMEWSLFGVNHQEVGALVIEKWKLPRAFREVILGHRSPRGGDSKLTLLVHAACEVANRLGFSFLPLKDTDAELGPADELGYSIALVINALECEYGI